MYIYMPGIVGDGEIFGLSILRDLILHLTASIRVN